MKNFKKVLGGAIALTMLCSVMPFGGIKAEAKDVPKYLKDDTKEIYTAYMYGDKALTITEDGTLYYDKKVSHYALEKGLYPTRISKKYAYATDYKQHVLFNIEDGSKENAFPMIQKMNKVVNDKYGFKEGQISTIGFIKSDTDVFWLEFRAKLNEKDLNGLVSSTGDIIELPFKEGENYQVSMHNNKAYVLYEKDGQYDLSIYSLNNEKANLCKITKDGEKDTLKELVVNENDDIYILSKGEDSIEKGQKEISKINLNDGKGTLTTIATYDYKRRHPGIENVAVDNNKNIWYLQDGLIYKIENDKPVLKYEVQKNKINLFVSDDNNIIVSGNEYDSDYPINNPFSNGKSTIINLSDKYTDGWVQERDGWQYYENRQAVTDGWKSVDGKWYYFRTDALMIQGWMNSNDGIYYLSTQGDAAIGWTKINDNWYYFNNNCAMARGWKQVDSQWYYLNDNGVMTTGWKDINGACYYMNENGSMQTGWKQLDGQWYYLNDNGSMATGWQKINGSWYYFYNNGTMAHDVTIDGYKIGINGIYS